MSALEWARRIQAIAQTGLAFCKDDYDRERYLQLQALAASMLASQLRIPDESAAILYSRDSGYATPKVDVRGAAFVNGRVLLVRERSDGCWTLPGGWADVEDSPAEAVVREIREESGFSARTIKLAAVYDRNRHGQPPAIHHAYKLCFICEITGGAPATSLETDAADFFALDDLPPLSAMRIKRGQIARMFAHAAHPELPADYD